MSTTEGTEASSQPHWAMARLAVAAIFFVNGFVFATWLPHIPAIQARLGLGPGALGLALLGMPLGAVISMPLAGWLSMRLGSRPIMLTASILYCLLVVPPLLSGSAAALAVALILLGAANGAMDVAMNARAVVVEHGLERPVMSSLHAQFSIGGLLGAAATIPASWAGMSPLTQVTAGAVIGLTLVGLSWRFHGAGRDGGGGHGPSFALPRGRLAFYGALAFFVLLCEGAAADWSAVYLSHSLAAMPALSGAAYAAFAMTMAVGRLTGDALVANLGPARVVTWGAWFAALGFGGALLVHHPAAAIAGFACLGLGVANIVPVLFSASGRIPGVPPGIGIAAMTTAGYGGFLAGPPFIGFLAEGVGLPIALGLLVGALSLVGVTAHRLGLGRRR